MAKTFQVLKVKLNPKINFTSPLTLSILAGILIGTSIIPFPPWAMLFCLSPLLKIWCEEKPKKVFLYTTLTFTIGSLISLYWFAFLLNEFGRMPWSASIAATFVIGVFYHIHVAVAAFIFAKWVRPFSKNKTFTAATVLAFVWLVFPMVFPWNFSLGWLYGGFQAYQFADLIGSNGLGAFTILLNAYFLFAISKFKETKIHIATGLLGFLALNFAGSLYSKLIPKPDSVYKVVIGQANIGNLEKRYMLERHNYKNSVIDDYLSVTAKGLEEAPGSPDVVIWPETAYPEYYDQNFFRTYSGIRLTSYIKKNDFNLITGVFAHTDENKTANAALFLNKNAEPVGDPIYKKILLMFGEYIPGEKTFPVLRKILPMVGDFARGDEPMVKDFDGVHLGVQICYEGLFPWFSRKLVNKGSQIFVNLTNDSWYGPYSEPQQHLYLSAFRAIENRQPLIRATNTGISTVVTADGSFLEKSPIYAQWAGYYEVPYSSEQKKTVYQQWGYAIPLPLTLILFIISLFYEPKKRADERKVDNTKI